MNIGILGTGMVGRALAGKLTELGHSVCLGTRDPAETLARSGPDRMGQPPVGEWLKQHPTIKLGTYAESAAHGVVLVNATNGAGSLDALRLAGADHLAGKVLLDISNPLDFSRGMPPTLFVKDTDSLAEQIQRAFPETQVVKTLNTLTAALMVNPGQLAGGDHSVFLSGDDANAKAVVADLLRSFGWRDIIDLGGLATARGAEMVLPAWLSLMGALRTPFFNLKVVR